MSKLPVMSSRFYDSLKLMLLSILIGLASAPSFANTENSFWTCDLMAELKGVPYSFLYYNKDSWQGQGNLRCTRNGEIIDEELVIQYEGWASATGLANKARLTLFSYFVPATHPREVLKSFPTASLGSIPTYYNFPVTTVLQVGRSRPFEVAVKASEVVESLDVPLNYGTLSISKKNQE